MHTEPATWSRRDRVAFYRLDAACFRKMAEGEPRSAIRERLVALAHHYRDVAKTLETGTLAA
jgi:hypothetical protein